MNLAKIIPISVLIVNLIINAATVGELVKKADGLIREAAKTENMLYVAEFSFDETLKIYKDRSIKKLQDAIRILFKAATILEKHNYKEDALKVYHKIVNSSSVNKTLIAKSFTGKTKKVVITLNVSDMQEVKIAKKKVQEVAFGFASLVRKLLAVGKKRYQLEIELLNNPDIADQYAALVDKEKKLSKAVAEEAVKAIKAKKLNVIDILVKALRSENPPTRALRGLVNAAKEIEKAIQGLLVMYYVEDPKYAKKLTQKNVEFSSALGYVAGYVSAADQLIPAIQNETDHFHSELEHAVNQATQQLINAATQEIHNFIDNLFDN